MCGLYLHSHWCVTSAGCLGMNFARNLAACVLLKRCFTSEFAGVLFCYAAGLVLVWGRLCWTKSREDISTLSSSPK